jgi:two-component sensor histidine kinase
MSAFHPLRTLPQSAKVAQTGGEAGYGAAAVLDVDATQGAAGLHLGSGRMAQLVRDHDWASTPLGPPADWPPELRTVVQQALESRFPKAIAWGAELTTIYNDAFRPILGDKPEALGRSFKDVWSEAWDDIGPIAKRAFEGEATFIENFPLIVDRNRGQPEQAWFTFCYSPLRLSDGTIAGMLDTVIETTSTMRARADMSLLHQELGHRLKNMIALVQSIAFQTLKDVTEQDSVAAFHSRLAALGHAHDILLRRSWSALPLSEVVKESLGPLDGLEQIQIEGPEVEIGSRAAMMISLIMHELATNAAKYGALSVPDARVRLSWRIEQSMFQMDWRESGGPEVAEPTRQGFGSRLMQRGLGGNGKVHMHYRPSGFELHLEIPADELSAQ